MKNISSLAIVLIILAAAGGFYGGMKFQESKTPGVEEFSLSGSGKRVSFQGGSGGNVMMRGEKGFRPVTGEIINADDKTITVKTEDGSTKIIVVSTNTSINKSASGTSADLKTGEKVAVFGSENADGSVTAQNIQLNPEIKNIEINDTIEK